MLESGKREREKGNDDENDEKSFVAVIEIIGIAFCLLLLRALVVSASEFDDDDDDFDGNRDDDSDGRVFVAAIERRKRRRKLEKEERGEFVYVVVLLLPVVSKNPRGDVLGNFRELPERFSAVESESDKGARKQRGILLRGRGRGGGGNHHWEENIVVVCVVRLLRSALAGFVWRMRVDARVERDTSERVGCAGGGGREVRSSGR